MAYNAKAQLTYNQKLTRITIKYTLKETDEAARLKQYLQDSGQAANSYIKSLIKADLDSKNINYPIKDKNSEA